MSDQSLITVYEIPRNETHLGGYLIAVILINTTPKWNDPKENICASEYLKKYSRLKD